MKINTVRSLTERIGADKQRNEKEKLALHHY
jgi:hypothetical protein